MFGACDYTLSISGCPVGVARLTLGFAWSKAYLVASLLLLAILVALVLAKLNQEGSVLTVLMVFAVFNHMLGNVLAASPDTQVTGTDKLSLESSYWYSPFVRTFVSFGLATLAMSYDSLGKSGTIEDTHTAYVKKSDLLRELDRFDKNELQSTTSSYGKLSNIRFQQGSPERLKAELGRFVRFHCLMLLLCAFQGDGRCN